MEVLNGGTQNWEAAFRDGAVRCEWGDGEGTHCPFERSVWIIGSNKVSTFPFPEEYKVLAGPNEPGKPLKSHNL